MRFVGITVAALVGVLGVACGSGNSGEGAPPLPDACEAGRCEGGSVLPDGGTTPKACTSDQGLSQLQGDCKRNTCDATGSIVVVADDSDVPPPSGECAEALCSSGQRVDKAKAVGATCAGGKCDGKGACVKPLGDACAVNADCSSGFCADGVCCDTACRGECQACNLAGSGGVCTNVPYYQPDASFDRDGSTGSCDFATSGARCNGQGKCLKVSGRPCGQDDHCMSNTCTAKLKCLGAKGEFCTLDTDCVSGLCLGGDCQ